MVRSPYERLEEFLRGEQGERIRDMDRSMRSGRVIDIATLLTSNSNRLASIGPLLTRTDRELRRAAAIIGTGPHAVPGAYHLGSLRARPRPISTLEGGLLVVDASPGSLDLLVEAYGAIVTLFTSQPILALTTALTLGQQSWALRVWFRRRTTGLSATDSRQAIDAIRGGRDISRLVSDAPDMELDISRGTDEGLLAVNRDADLGSPLSPEVVPRPTSESEEAAHITIGPLEASGHRITLVRTYPDGAQDIIRVESSLRRGTEALMLVPGISGFFAMLDQPGYQG